MTKNKILTTDREWSFTDARVRKLVDECAPAPSGSHFLVIKTNSDGRPCGWGKAPEFDLAVQVADQMWDQHGEVMADGKRCGSCYPGETVGVYEVHLVSSAPLHTQMEGQ